MNILVVGNGGREHAICWKTAQSPLVEKIYCAPGNAGTANVAQNVPINVLETDKLLDFALNNNIGLTVVGPEVPLCEGIVNKFNDKDLLIFGPDKASAQLEGSKCYSKNFMNKYNIPTAESAEFTSKNKACEYIEKMMRTASRIVIKADGLAAGKGVLIAESLKEAKEAISTCFEGTFGEAGKKILIEEYLEGEEASILALTDGNTIIPLVPSQDHKRVGEGDTGLNTGGMGAYCPAPVINKTLMDDINVKVLQRFLHGIQKEKLYYKGIIYAGIMVTKNGPKVLEFNVRFGDPEVQAVMTLMKSDLVDIMLKAVNGNLDKASIEWFPGSSVCVVMASKGYPGSYEKGFTISGIDKAEETGSVVFHAGTSLKNENIVTSGGRVLGVTSRADNINDAINKVYKSVEKIKWNGAFYRKDIAHKALY